MNKKMKLFSTDEKTKGLTVNLTVVGEVTFDKEENFIEVDKEKGEALLEKVFGMTLLREDDHKTKRERELENLLEKEKEEKDKLEATVLEQKEKLSKLDDKELGNLLVDIPEKEKKKLTTREKIIDYFAVFLSKK